MSVKPRNFFLLFDANCKICRLFISKNVCFLSINGKISIALSNVYVDILKTVLSVVINHFHSHITVNFSNIVLSKNFSIYSQRFNT